MLRQPWWRTDVPSKALAIGVGHPDAFYQEQLYDLHLCLAKINSTFKMIYVQIGPVTRATEWIGDGHLRGNPMESCGRTDET